MSDQHVAGPDEVRDVPTRWPVVASRDLHRDDWVVALRADTVHRPGAPEETFTRLVLEHCGAVVVLAVDDDERVCCIRHYRHAVSSQLVQLPAGLRDNGDEDPVETAKRELREEAELQATEWRHLLTTLPSGGISAEEHVIYLARGLSHSDRGEFELHAEEADMDVLWVPMPELLDAVLHGRVHESPLVAAVLAYDVLKRRGEL